MASVIRGNDNFDSAGGAAMKAWVNFNGTGTVAIRGSYNVSSITDNATGEYTVNFAVAMADANYCAVAGGSTPGSRGNLVSTKHNQSSSSCEVNSYSPSGTKIDASEVSVSIFS